MAPQPLLPIFLLSLCILPVSIWLALILGPYVKLRPYLKTHNWPSSPSAIRKRVLLTGDDDGAILATARALKASGSTVYSVKLERIPFANCLWTSKAVHKYVGLASGRLTPILRRLTRGTRFTFALPANLPGSILNLVEAEKIDLWIQCDGSKQTIAQMQAKEIVLKHTTTKLFEPDIDTARLARGYSLFAHHMRHHETEVHCPKTIVVRTRAEIHDYLWKAPKGQHFLLERMTTGAFSTTTKANSGTKRDSGYDDSATLVNDSNSSDSDDFAGAETSTPTTSLAEDHVQLPLATPNQTYSAVAAMQVSPASPWIMHEAIHGIPGTISALVVNGSIRVFIARIGSEERTFSNAQSRGPLSTKRPIKLGNSHEHNDLNKQEQSNFVNPASTIGTALLRYAQRFASSLAEKPSTHLNLHFFITDRVTPNGAEQKIVATGVHFGFSPVLAQQALACGVGEAFGRAITATTLTPDDVPLLLPTPTAALMAADVRQPAIRLPRATSASAEGESLNALAKALEDIINESDSRYDRKDLVPWIWGTLVQAPIEMAFEGLVEMLESSQARKAKWS